MLDWLIEGGSVVDGTGSAPFSADVGIRDGRIVAVGSIGEAARERIDARGAWVTPGFIDIHTHYDGQATWDETFSPSIHHGVTTVVMGNCGVGFAPVERGREGELIKLMEGVEDIPGAALAEGIRWNWESFPQFMDALDATPHSLDYLLQIPHDPVRMAVMGERAFTQQAAGADDIAAMRALVREALQAGAVGFSSGRSDNHRTSEGRETPAAEATAAELTGIAEAFDGLVARRDPDGQRLRRAEGPRALRCRVRSDRAGRARRRATALDDLAAARSGRRAMGGDPRARRRGRRARTAALSAGRRARHRRDQRARRQLPSVHGLSRLQGDRAPAARRARRRDARPGPQGARPRREIGLASPATAARFRRWSTSCSPASSWSAAACSRSVPTSTTSRP